MMDWEESGLLRGLSDGEKVEIIPLFDEVVMLLDTIDGKTTQALSLPAIRRIYSNYGVFDVEHMLKHLSTYCNSDRVRSMMDNPRNYNWIDGEAKVLSTFCEKYKPQPMGIEPKKMIKGFKLKNG